MKTRKAAAKRFQIKKSGTVMRRHSGRRHLLECKSGGQRRRLKGNAVVSPSDVERIWQMLPGGAN